jgi:hypothetical protein
MAMRVDELTIPRPQLDLVEPPWDEYLKVFGLPRGLLTRAAHPDLHVVVAAAGGRLRAAIDGEPAELETPLELRVEPRALRVRLPTIDP